jgi:hypothetical protein
MERHRLTTGVLALAIDPTNPTLLYAGTYEFIFKSTDGGSTWTAVYSTGYWFEPVNTLAVDATGTLYAGTGDCHCFEGCGCRGGVITSTDGGGTWSAPA